jgi:hypothetical protein
VRGAKGQVGGNLRTLRRVHSCATRAEIEEHPAKSFGVRHTLQNCWLFNLTVADRLGVGRGSQRQQRGRFFFVKTSLCAEC